MAAVTTERDRPSEIREEEYVLPLRSVLQALWSKLWLIVLVCAVAAGSAIGLSLLQTPQYEASARVLIGQEGSFGQTPGDALSLEQVTVTMVEAVESRPVAEAVVQNEASGLSTEEFYNNLTVQQVSQTQFIELTYTDPEPERAQRLVNSAGDEFSAEISEVSTDAGGITATVWEQATVPASPASPNPVGSGILGLGLGLMLGVLLALLWEYLGSGRRPEETGAPLGVPR